MMYGTSRVERYLYSLPEYRMEIQRSHFIEIYSYNGLLATRKVIEFDGDTVLCRVCGDKASGFHYGVHACEGCKGFFRRSIQQKIQYRPCLKNQQCNIMRVNRNRCQYCRLKKCISVGMSRDAVRFGRVPKKEKAKIMEQMQKVNSQSQVNLLSTILESEGDITQKIVDAYNRTCEFTHTKFRSFFETAWRNPQFVNCSAHLACPFNPSPESTDGAKISEEFSECFTPAIRNVVNFAKSIPGFLVLSQEDQVTLLKAGTFEVLLVHLACLFDSQTNTMLFMNGKLFKRVNVTVTNSAGFLLDSMFDFADRMNGLHLTDEEIALFSAIVVIASDRPGLRNVEQVEKVQTRITQALQAMMAANHQDDPSLFAKLLMKISDLRTLNTLHSEKLLGLQVAPSPAKNGGPPDKLKASPDSAYYRNGMLAPGLGMLGGGGAPSQPLTPAQMAHQVAMASSQQAMMEARLQMHPSFRGFNPYNPAAAAAAMHMKHYQTNMAETGKCPFPRPDKVKCERPNGYKSDAGGVPVPETSRAAAGEATRRFYEAHASQHQQLHKNKHSEASHTSPHARYEGETQQQATDLSHSTRKEDTSSVNGGSHSDSMYSHKNSHHVPYWMMPKDLAGQGQQRFDEGSSVSPRRETTVGEKRVPPDQEEESRKKVAKIWDVPVGESTQKDSAAHQAFQHTAKMYQGFVPHALPGSQHFLPYPGFPGPPRGEFPYGPVPPSPRPAGSLPRNPIGPAKASPPNRDSKDTALIPNNSPKEQKTKSSPSPATAPRSESSLNLPVLKSVLSSPPLANPALWGDNNRVSSVRRRHSNEDANQTVAHPVGEDRSHSEDYIREKSSQLTSLDFEPIQGAASNSSKSISPFDPYTMHKKLKVKHHRTSTSSGSERSTPASTLGDANSIQGVTHNQPNSTHTPPSSTLTPPNSAQSLPNPSSSPMLNCDRRPSSSELELRNARTENYSGHDFDDFHRPHPNSEGPNENDKIPAEYHPPPTEMAKDETQPDGRSNFPKVNHKVNYHNIRDHIEASDANNHRVLNHTSEGSGKTEGVYSDWKNDIREGRHQKEAQLTHPGYLQATGYQSHPPQGVVPPHPAYLPQMGFPGGAGAVHPALLYQYNQYAAGLQLAQLQHLQMAQAAHLAQLQASKERSAVREHDSSNSDQPDKEGRFSPPLPLNEISSTNDIQVKQEPV